MAKTDDASPARVAAFRTGVSAETRERMERPETIELIRLYYAITDLKVRQSFLDMVKSVAESGKRKA